MSAQGTKAKGKDKLDVGDSAGRGSGDLVLTYRLPTRPSAVNRVRVQRLPAAAPLAESALATLRDEAVAYLRERALGLPDASKVRYNALRDRLAAAVGNAATASPALAALLEDWTSQVAMALQPDYYEKWGRHYLLAMAHGHERQVCTNHKDGSLAVYGGARSAEIVAKANVTFNLMPPPQASRGRRGHAIRSTAVFNNRSAGCVHANTAITLADGTLCPARDIRPGMALRTPDIAGRGADGHAARVTHVMASRIGTDAPLAMVAFPTGLRITPWHPVWVPPAMAATWAPAKCEELQKAGGGWVFPAEAGLPTEKLEADAGGHATYVYAFALEGGAPSFLADDIPAIALAHGIENDAVATHPFYGTNAVLAALERAAVVSGDGIHMLEPGVCLVDPVAALVSDFVVSSTGQD
jgi:hypothetical protein